MKSAGALTMPRSRGAVCGSVLVILGAWGALIPFVGPRFNFAYTPDGEWVWTTARGWLEVLPGAATALGGVLLMLAGNRITAMLGGWLAVLGGAWFVLGGQVAPLLGIGPAGDPVAATEGKRAALEIAYFSGLGALIIFVGGIALVRTAVRLARDVKAVKVGAYHHEPEAFVPPAQPLYSGLQEPSNVSSGALTKPREGYGPRPEQARGWHRQSTAAPGSPGEAPLRWPRPQR